MKKQERVIKEFRNAFKKKIECWANEYPSMFFVYNEALETIDFTKKIECVIVGDNPGYEEVGRETYLVGQAGKLGKHFFEEVLNESDFYKSAVFLNKTPIATPKTKGLEECPLFIVQETQRWMAKKIAKLCKDLKCDVYIIGASNLETIFETFMRSLKKERREICFSNKGVRSGVRIFSILVFNHFSRNSLKVDFSERYPNGTLSDFRKMGLEDSRKFYSNFY